MVDVKSLCSDDLHKLDPRLGTFVQQLQRTIGGPPIAILSRFECTPFVTISEETLDSSILKAFCHYSTRQIGPCNRMLQHSGFSSLLQGCTSAYQKLEQKYCMRKGGLTKSSKPEATSLPNT